VREILYFTASWCNPCKKVKPIVEELNSEMKDKIKIIDVDDNFKKVQEFEIKSVPTFVVLVDGKEVERRTGAQTRDELVELYSRV
jgi:thioredoxin 1